MNTESINKLKNIIIKEYNNINGLVVLKDGKTVYEGYFNGNTSENTNHLFSVTKSIFSGLIGIAVDKGHIQSIDQRVVDFFPDFPFKSGENQINDITLLHLLTMTAPYRYDPEPYEAFFTSEDWMAFALEYLGGDEKIGEFRYSPIVGSHILSGILVKAIGQPILGFASEHLFKPLGIEVNENVSLPTKEEHLAFPKDRFMRGWAVDPQGINAASWGLTLSPGEMAKIGQLYLNQGMWEGKQIISKKWIQESTTKHSSFGQMAYGYLWWILDEKDRVYAALGDGGNAIYINTKENMIISIGASFMPDVKDPLALIKNYIEPMVQNQPS